MLLMHTTKTAVCLQTMFVIKLNFVFSDYSFSELSLYFHMIYMYNDPGRHVSQCMCSWPGGGALVSTLPGCVCRKVKDMGPFSASRE